MQIYCGTDIIEVDRIKDAVKNTKGFRESIYTENEIKEIEKIRCDMKYQRYAGRFAAKEAIYKAMSKILIENNTNINFLDIEIINIEELKKRPKVVVLSEEVKKLCDDLNIQIDISISHISQNAIATAVVKID